MQTNADVANVKEEDYSKLEALLESRLPKSGMLYNVLRLTQSLNIGNKISVKFYADNHCQEMWSLDSDGTFMGAINILGLPRNIIVFSGPPTGSTQETVAALLSALDWSQEIQFEGVDTSISPTLVEVALKYGSVNQNDPIGLYYMTREEALAILSEKDQISISNSNIRASSLHPSDAHMVQDRWPEKVDGYLEMLQASIELCSSGGVYIVDDVNKSVPDRLVSFAVALPFGSIHAFHTEPDQRRKGFGKLTMKVLAKNIALAGRIPLVQIYEDNDNSKAINVGIGFKYSHKIFLITFRPNKAE
ncbi:uncharacterized protein LOC119068257 isoform X1 [Bradysia coprophila]|uniref:uncharacterized protein LOC119068257 isoform X1 n=1 Tax=Bradysia coprophila TaxID=38358 RepID=UPI00187D9196|nr:uncharacterized protein LOC119068257 isoform X1 [Bradysia coprophila]